MAGLVIARVYDHRINDCGDDRRDPRHLGSPFLPCRDHQGQGRGPAPGFVFVAGCHRSHRADKGKYPETIQALVSAGYLRPVSADPITGAIRPGREMVDQAEGGMVDVFSGSELMGKWSSLQPMVMV